VLKKQKVKKYNKVSNSSVKLLYLAREPSSNGHLNTFRLRHTQGLYNVLNTDVELLSGKMLKLVYNPN